jgi:hypothetical protein
MTWQLSRPRRLRTLSPTTLHGAILGWTWRQQRRTAVRAEPRGGHRGRPSQRDRPHGRRPPPLVFIRPLTPVGRRNSVEPRLITLISPCCKPVRVGTRHITAARLLAAGREFAKRHRRATLSIDRPGAVPNFLYCHSVTYDVSPAQTRAPWLRSTRIIKES